MTRCVAALAIQPLPADADLSVCVGVQFMELFMTKVKGLKLGDPFAPETFQGRSRSTIPLLYRRIVPRSARGLRCRRLDCLSALTLTPLGPFFPPVQTGPQISQTQYDRIMKHIDSGKTEGATLLAGGAQHGKEVSRAFALMGYRPRSSSLTEIICCRL
jgi:hypothetical protein